MARRREPGLADAVMELVALLPWWAGVALALAAYLILHAVATQPVAAITQPSQMQGAIFGAVAQGLAGIGQYVLPLICLAGAAASALARRKRTTLVREVGRGDAADALHGMSWREFEMLVGEAFRLQGYAVVETGGGGADGGVDLELRKDRELHLVQCKQWKAYTVGVSVVRELFGVMAARGAVGGYVVTSGRFTDDARSFAEGRNIRLVEGAALLRMIRPAQAGRPPLASRARAKDAVARPVSTPVAPTCPTCGARMVERTAKKGKNAGQPFWGCGTYPDCRGIRPID